MPLSTGAQESEERTEGILRYVIVDNSYAIVTGINDYPEGDVLVIPQKLGGYPVKELRSLNDYWVMIIDQLHYLAGKTVVIPKGVTTIGSRCFQLCGLKAVYFPKSLTTVGFCAFNYNNPVVYFEGSKEEINISFVYGGLEDPSVASTDKWVFNADYSAYYNEDVVTFNIIDEVKKYTSDGADLEYFNYLMSNNSFSNQKRFELFSEYFLNHGITDYHEGFQYASDCSDKRWRYNSLICDDIYCATNFDYYLNNTTKGKIARADLAVSGFVFNNDLGDYVSGQIPAVENYKTMLLDFMEASADEVEMVKNVNNISKFLQKSVDILTAAQKQRVIDELQKVGTLKDSQNLLSQLCVYVDEIKKEKGEFKIEFEDTDFTKGIGYEADFANLLFTGVEDIRAYFMLSSKIATINSFRDFLTDIVQAGDQLPLTLRYAAKELLEETELGYLVPIEQTVRNLFDITKDVVTDKIMKVNLKKEIISHFTSDAVAENFCSTLAAYKLSAWAIEQLFGAGALANKAAYVEGYSKLSKFYKNKLINDKSAFTANPTEDNAWQFYYDYTMLWHMRYEGESAYLKMNDFPFLVKLVTNNNYKMKTEYVNTVLSDLMNIKFVIPENVTVPAKFNCQKKIVVKCPVDVTVYSPSGNVITTLYDGKECVVENEYGKFVVTYSPFFEEYIKIMYFKNNDNYRIETVGTDKGLVEYEKAEINKDNNAEYSAIDNITVDTGSKLITDTSSNEYLFDYNNDGNYEITDKALVKSTEAIAPTEIQLSADTINVDVKDSIVLNVSVLPIDATEKSISWISLDSNIATIKNGKVTGVKRGSTEIIAKANGVEDVSKTITVNVISDLLGDCDGDGEITAADVVIYRRFFSEQADAIDLNTIKEADYNGDGFINAKDLLIIRQLLAK